LKAAMNGVVEGARSSMNLRPFVATVWSKVRLRSETIVPSSLNCFFIGPAAAAHPLSHPGGTKLPNSPAYPFMYFPK
jgi:hypothetical protein